MEENWEEALDLDDSDLPSPLPCKRPKPQINNNNSSQTPFLQPCSQIPHLSQSQQPNPTLLLQTLASQSQQTLPQFLSNSKERQGVASTSSPRRIPGPAGNVQAAMNRRARDGNGDSEERNTTQDYLRRQVEDGFEEDLDFKRNSWLCAMEFLVDEKGSKGFSVLDANGNVKLPCPLGSIKILPPGIDRVTKVVAVITSCKPNGLGDLSVTLKDTTGTIGANIRRKVITESEFGKNISVGSVLFLQQVAVFSFSHLRRYLNITLRNMVKVISKDSGPPTKIFHASSDVHREVTRQMVNESSFSRHRGTEGVRNAAVMDNWRIPVDDDCQMEESRPEVEALVRAEQTIREAVRLATNYADQAINDNDGSKGGSSNCINYSSSATNVGKQAAEVLHHKNVTGNAVKHKQQIISSASVAQWTDEQLDELFADSWE